jgi:hypothetical protein
MTRLPTPRMRVEMIDDELRVAEMETAATRDSWASGHPEAAKHLEAACERLSDAQMAVADVRASMHAAFMERADAAPVEGRS